MTFFFYSGVILAVADWIAVTQDARTVRWVTKPGTLLALLLWFTTATPATTDPRITWFTLALCFSLVGDFFLLMEGHQILKGGLSFILAHIAFVIAFNIPLNIPPIFFGIFILNLIPTIISFRDITGAIKKEGDKDLAWGVSLYALVLTVMSSSALTTLFRSEWKGLAGWLTAGGALLFYISDLLMFHDRFVRHRARAQLIVMMLYHLAQFALTYGYLWFLYS